MEMSNYIESELLIIVPVLYVLGLMIKRSSIDDRWIPLILGIMGIVLATAYKLTAHMPDNTSEVFALIFAGITQGLLCASGSVYANNIVKQFKNKNTEGDSLESSDKDDSGNDSGDDSGIR